MCFLCLCILLLLLALMSKKCFECRRRGKDKKKKDYSDDQKWCDCTVQEILICYNCTLCYLSYSLLFLDSYIKHTSSIPLCFL